MINVKPTPSPAPATTPEGQQQGAQSPRGSRLLRNATVLGGAAAGGFVGFKAGAAAGAIVGGPPGAAIGGVVGGAGGAAVGGYGAYRAYNALQG